MSNDQSLSHIKVLDLSRILAGPWASQTLADLGADVIKVERPDVGDDTRHWGPPYMQNEAGGDSEQSAYFMSTNRGKRSICVDIASDEGQEILHKLATTSDVLIENFKVGQTKKYKLDYATLKEINPRLIYCSITGFGQTGPYRDRPGYDFLLQAMGGLMSVTGEPGGMPQKVGVAVTDILTGLYATIGILAALAEREKSGLGQHVDLALMDVTVAAMANQATNYLVGKQLPKPMGNAHPNIVPYECFATQDGHCIVAVGNDSQFESFCEVLDASALAKDNRFLTNQLRVDNREELISAISSRMLLKNRDDWLALFETAGVPAAPINNLEDVFNDPQVLSREMRISLPHQENSGLELVGSPIKLSRTPVNYNRAPPKLGEHTQEVLESLNSDKN